jgi:uncharacterized membrane protein
VVEWAYIILFVLSDPTYTSDIRPIFERRCSQCHNASWAAKNWLDYDTAYANRILIKTRVSNETMPPSNQTGMTKEERDLVIKWIDGGAKK